MKPVVAGALGAVAFLVVLLVGAGLGALTHLSTVGNVLGLFGVVLGAWLASRLADGPVPDRVAAGVGTPAVAAVLALVMAARSGLRAGTVVAVIPFLVVVAMAGAFGVIAGIQGANDEPRDRR